MRSALAGRKGFAVAKTLVQSHAGETFWSVHAARSSLLEGTMAADALSL